MAVQSELILKIQALGEEQIAKVGKMLDDLEKTTETWSAAQQRAAMRMSAMHEEALKLNEGMAKQSTILSHFVITAGDVANAASAIGRAFVQTLTETLDWAEGLEKANKQTGISMEFWQKLIKTGAEMNTGFDEIRGAVERMERAIEGDGKALAKFGIDIEAFKALSPDDAFRQMAVQITSIQDPTERAAAAMAVFGRSGAELLPMLQAIVDGSVDLQNALDNKAVKSLLAADQALDKAKTAWTEAKNATVAFIVETLPVVPALENFKLGLDAIGAILRQWPGWWELAKQGVFATLGGMIEGARTAQASQEALAHATRGVSDATKEAAIWAQNSVKQWGALGVALERLAKDEEKAKVATEKHRIATAQAQKAAQDRALVAVAASQKELDAELKRMNGIAQGEKELTAKVRAEEAAQFLAVQEKCRKAEAEAERYFQRVIDGSNRASLSEIEQARQTLANVIAMRQQLVANHEATNEQMLQADAALAAARKQLDDAEREQKIAHFESIAESATSILRSMFGKSKAMAIATAIIDAAAAIVKVFAQLGWWGIPVAAAIAAKTAAEISKIRSQNAGFRTGTPGTSFVDFGRGQLQMLHGQEAIVTRGQAESVASMVRRAIDDANRKSVSRPNETDQNIQVVLKLDSKHVADVLLRRNRAGLMPMRAT